MKQLIAAFRWTQPHWRDAGSLVFAIALAGCAHSPEVFQWEPRAVARQLGTPGCRVSVPMSESAVVEILKRWDSIDHPEDNSEWVAITSNHQPGDQLRMVSCKDRNPFYALIRDDKILFKYTPTMYD
jgi:hypothetical protein